LSFLFLLVQAWDQAETKMSLQGKMATVESKQRSSVDLASSDDDSDIQEPTSKKLKCFFRSLSSLCPSHLTFSFIFSFFFLLRLESKSLDTEKNGLRCLYLSLHSSFQWWSTPELPIFFSLRRPSRLFPPRVIASSVIGFGRDCIGILRRSVISLLSILNR
jgi:hypothetical protein